MQHIFHHNSSGNNAYTGDLLSHEVLRAISLHPIKISKYQYRLHNFMNLRKMIDLRQRYLSLKREIFNLKTEILSDEALSMNNKSKSTNTPLFSSSNDRNNHNDDAVDVENAEIYSDFENLILNKKENLSDEELSNRFFLPPSLQMLKTPKKREDRHDFDFFTRSLFSSTYISPNEASKGIGRIL